MTRKGENWYRVVPIFDPEWRELESIAASMDLTANKLVSLIARNYLAKRWTLELLLDQGAIRAAEKRRAG